MLKRLLKQDWDAIAGILAAMAALVLHFLHVTDLATLVAIALVLMALLLLRDFRRESQAEGLTKEIERLAEKLTEVRDAVRPPSIALIGPSELRDASMEFARKGRGQVVWFNVCLRMYQQQPPFDILMKPFLDNPAIASVRFVLDNREKERWQKSMGCPRFRPVPGLEKGRGALLARPTRTTSPSCWWRRAAAARPRPWSASGASPSWHIGVEKNVPRYVLHVKGEGSELIARLREYERRCSHAHSRKK